MIGVERKRRYRHSQTLCKTDAVTTDGQTTCSRNSMYDGQQESISAPQHSHLTISYDRNNQNKNLRRGVSLCCLGKRHD